MAFYYQVFNSQLTIARCIFAFILITNTATFAQQGYSIVRSFPHDSTAFTEGLAYEGGYLYESTGIEGRSSIRKMSLETGNIMQVIVLDDSLFGEGMTIMAPWIFQLTWKANIGFVYDLENMNLIEIFPIVGEGWGITNDGKYLIISDGTAILRRVHPISFELIDKITVYDHDSVVAGLNELEFINDEILANIWHTYLIVRISPKTGCVLGWIDLQGILTREDQEKCELSVLDNIVKQELRIDEACLNGIAYDRDRNRLIITGKLWPKLFEIKVISPDSI